MEISFLPERISSLTLSVLMSSVLTNYVRAIPIFHILILRKFTCLLSFLIAIPNLLIILVLVSSIILLVQVLVEAHAVEQIGFAPGKYNCFVNPLLLMFR